MSISPVELRATVSALGRTPALRGTYAKETFARRCPVHVGVDAGKHFHKLVARGPTGPRGPAVRVEVTRAGFEPADRYLTEQFPDIARAQMLVGLEFAGHNGFTFARFLASRGYPVVSVLAFVTKRLKEVEDNSPRKDDAKDAGQICALLSQGLFVGFPLLSDAATELRLLATERRRLAVEATRLKKRLHAALHLAWPEFVAHFAGLEFETPIALLERWPLPEDLAAASPQAVHALVRKISLNHISPERSRAISAQAKSTMAVPEGAAARRAELQRLLARWRSCAPRSWSWRRGSLS